MWWCALVTWAVTVVVTAAAGAGASRCERITVPLCQDIGYNLTAMPNLLGHEDQLQAEKELVAFLPLVHVGCAARLLRPFLCAAFAPLCTEHVARPVPACRGLCEAVAADCARHLGALRVLWPPELNCSRFPEPQDALCMQAPPEPGPPSPSSPAPAVHGGASEAAAGASSASSAAAPPPPPPGPRCPPDFARARRPSGAVGCAPRCGRDAFYRAEDKRFAETWMTGWAWLCFLSTLFTLLTFWVEPARFRYPERPVVFLALAYNLLALAVMARGALGAAAVACVAPSDGGAPHLAADGLHSGACTLSFLALYYFGLASGIWWLVLCACWFLSAAKQWSCEALQGLSTYFHVAAWATPAILGLSALVMHHVAADELTGLCQVVEGAVLLFVVLPHGALLLSGCILAGLGGASLFRVRRAMRAAGRSTAKLERLMTRLGVFAALYVIPVAGSLACLLYEAWHRPRWRSLALLAALDCHIHPSCTPGPAYSAAGVEVALLRLFLSLVVGVTSGMWVWSGKTCRAWSRLFTAPRKQRLTVLGTGPLHVSRV